MILILVIGNLFITREGFFDGNNAENTPGVTTSAESLREDNCVFDRDSADKDCNKGTTDDGNEFKIHNVCPFDPRCLGTCVNDFTWTDENKAQLRSFN